MNDTIPQGQQPVSGAELAACCTAAAALQADFERERHGHAMVGGPVPDWRSWAHRLSTAVAGLLDGASGAGDLDDGTEPYCTTCGTWCGMFLGMDGWHHFRGDPAPGGERVLYEAGHPAVIGWTEPPRPRGQPGRAGHARRGSRRRDRPPRPGRRLRRL